MLILRHLVLLALLVVHAPTGTAAGHSSPFHFGDSVRHSPLVAVATGPRDARHTMVVIGCIHGNEGAGIQIIHALRNGATDASVRIWTVTCANPDGHVSNTRQNANGVDLNRNFPYRWHATGSRGDTYYPGPRVASEPETRAVMRLVRTLRPDITIWYHQHMNLVDRPRGARRAALARAYARATGMRLRSLQGYHGSASCWQNLTFPAATSFVVELPAGSLSTRMVRRHAAAVRQLARSLSG